MNDQDLDNMLAQHLQPLADYKKSGAFGIEVMKAVQSSSRRKGKIRFAIFGAIGVLSWAMLPWREAVSALNHVEVGMGSVVLAVIATVAIQLASFRKYQ